MSLIFLKIIVPKHFYKNVLLFFKVPGETSSFLPASTVFFPFHLPFSFQVLIYTCTHSLFLSISFFNQLKSGFHTLSHCPLSKFSNDLPYNHHWLFQVSSFWPFLLYFILVIKFIEILSSSGFQDIAVSQISFCLCYYY